MLFIQNHFLFEKEDFAVNKVFLYLLKIYSEHLHHQSNLPYLGQDLHLS